MTPEKVAWNSQRIVFWRKVLLCLPLVGAFALLYGYMDSTFRIATLNRWWIGFAILFCMGHIIYLLIVFERTLVSKPLSLFSSWDAYMSAALVTAYCLFALSIFLENKTLYCLSLLAFACVYALWIKLDFKEKVRQEAIDPRRAHTERVWLFIDIVMVMLMIGAFVIKVWHWWSNENAIFYADVFPVAVYNFTGEALFANHVKDAAVIFCILMYIKTRMDIIPKNIDYVQRWSAYLAHTRARHFQRVSEGDIQKVLSKNLDGERGCIVIDVGCANGKRFTELYDHVVSKNCGARPVQLIGIDTAPDWKVQFDNTMERFKGKVVASYSTIIDYEFRQKPNCVYLSHMLYDPVMTKQMVKIVQRVEPGSLVFVRGIAANSWFYEVSIVWSAKRFGPFPQHSWRTDGLKALVEECGLVPLARRGSLDPDWVIHQYYEMSQKQDAHSIAAAVDCVFDHNALDFVEDVCVALFEIGVSKIQNWDLLFVYQKGPARGASHT